MKNKGNFYAFNCCEYHKGFYNDKEPAESLEKINYTDFFEDPKDEEFPYDSARQFLNGSCNIFSLSLKKILNYTPYIIEGRNGICFHSFCQIYRECKWYYVDARGITTNFEEFINIPNTPIFDEFIIRPVNSDDIEDWESNFDYNKEAYAFAEAVIEKFREYYIL